MHILGRLQKKLNVEPYYISFASSGITQEGIFTTTSNMLDHYSNKRVIEDELPNCDLMVLFVGTNDANADKEVFKTGYQEVVLKLHDRYPEINIVCMIPFNQSQNEAIREVGEQYPWCHVVETIEWNITYSDGIHPNPNGADVISENLSNYIIEQELLKNN